MYPIIVFCGISWYLDHLISCPLMKLESRANDCFPEPPTPTSRALPQGLAVMRQIPRRTWHVARGTTPNMLNTREKTLKTPTFLKILGTSFLLHYLHFPTCFSHPKTKRIEADRGGSRHDRRAAPHRRKAQDSWWRARCCKRQALPAKKNRRISTRSLQAKQKIFSVDSHLHHVPNLLHVPSRQIKPLSTRSLTTEFIRTRNRQNCLKGLLNIVDDTVILPREWSSYMYGPYGPYGLYGPLRALRALTDRTGPLQAPYGHFGTYGPLATVQKLTSPYMLKSFLFSSRYWP